VANYAFTRGLGLRTPGDNASMPALLDDTQCSTQSLGFYGLLKTTCRCHCQRLCICLVVVQCIYPWHSFNLFEYAYASNATEFSLVFDVIASWLAAGET
jgi:hypothetical protein